MKTKDKILLKAREMFNEHGITRISSRAISEEVGISYGNLCYHFPRKDDLILQLYHDMQHELDEAVNSLQAQIFNFDFMVRGLRGMLEVLYRYKFIYLDLYNLFRRFPTLQSHAKKQYIIRISVCRQIYDFLMQEGYLLPERFDGHYDKLAHAVLMMINGWIVDAEIYYNGTDDPGAVIDHYLQIIYRVINPSLTKKGEEAFMNVYLDLKARRTKTPQSSLSKSDQV